MAKKKYYNWDRTLSYSQPRTYAVFGAKNIGKTFGIRLKSIERFLATGLRMVEIDRSKTALPALSSGYFGKLQEKGFFTEYEFKTNTDEMLVKAPDDTDFRVMGYFIALTAEQDVKKRTFANIGNFIFDECIIERANQRYHNYLPDEVATLGRIVDSVAREDELDPNTWNSKLFLLGNSCDLHAPYLEWLGIANIPERYGYYWCRNRTALFHFPEPVNVREKVRNTLAGQILAGNASVETAYENKFDTKGELTFVSPKTKSAKWWGGIVYGNAAFGLWIDYGTGIVYVNRQVPRNSGNIMYLTGSDGRIDYIAVSGSNTAMRIIKQMYYDSLIRYDSLATKGAFAYVLAFLGVRAL